MSGAVEDEAVDTVVTDDDGEDVEVLHLDDDEAFLEMCQKFLTRRHGLSVRTLTDPADALYRIEGVDCVVSDYDMPSMDGIEFLERVRDRDPDLPFILFTGKGSEEVAGDAISAGVTDYLQKGTGSERFQILANRVRNAVERERARDRAAESDRRIRQVYERITDGFVALDDEWRYTYVNRQAAELLESDPEELLGETIWSSFPGTLDTPMETELRRSFDEQTEVGFEEYYDPLDRWFEIRTFPAESGLSVYFRDVTERKKRERRYEAIFNQTYQFTGLMDPDGTLLEANESALEFAGVDREDVVGDPLWESYWFQASDDARRVAREAVARARAGEFYRREVLVQGADRESVIDFSVRPVTDESGEVTLLIPEGRDITELKEREAELREERAFVDSVFAALPDVFYAFDENGQFLRWNDRLTEVTGYTDEEIAEMTPLDFVPDSEVDAIASAIDDVIVDDRVVTVESAFETKDGEVIPYEFTGAKLTDEHDDLLGLVGIGRDVSDLDR